MDKNNIIDKGLHEEELINSYLRGEMSDEEESNFMSMLKDSEELKEKAILIARMAKAMKEVGEDKDAEIIDAFSKASVDVVEAVSGKTDTKASANQSKKNRFRIVRTLSIAASLALLVVFGYQYYDYRVTTGLGEEYSTVLSESSYMRRGTSSDEVSMKLYVLFTNVKDSKDLDSTIAQLNEIWIQSTNDTYNDYTNYAPQIGWYLAIAYLKDNKRKEAKQTLEKLMNISDDGSLIFIKVEEILIKL